MESEELKSPMKVNPSAGTSEASYLDSSEAHCESPGFDGLDDDLFQDLEDLGEVLDELNKETEDSEETASINETVQRPDDTVVIIPDDDPVIEVKKSSVASSESDKSQEETDTSAEEIEGREAGAEPKEELEDGEIIDDDEKIELEELYKKKLEVLNKLKRMVKHKIQLTSQRQDLIQDTVFKAHCDRQGVLLKENSLLVKAISNQIFRLNPDIKKINARIKELEAALGVFDSEQNTEKVPLVSFECDRDTETFKQFFDGLSSPREKKKLLEKNYVYKIRPLFKSPHKEIGSASLADKSPSDMKMSLNFSSYRSNLSFDEKKRETHNEAVQNFGSLTSLMGNNERLKKIFDRVCLMSGKPPPTPSLYDKLQSSEMKEKSAFARASDASQEKRRTSLERDEYASSSGQPDNSVRSSKPLHLSTSFSNPGMNTTFEESIDFNLKKIRQTVSLNSTGEDSPMDTSSSSSTPITLGRKPISFKVGPSAVATKGSKSSIALDFDKSDATDMDAKEKTFEPRAFGRLSKSLQSRLGPHMPRDDFAPKNDHVSQTETSEKCADVFGEGSRPAAGVKRHQEERTAFYCGYCKIPFHSSNNYIVHLESKKHLNQAFTARFKNKKPMRPFLDNISAYDSLLEDGDTAWYKGLSEKASNLESKTTVDDAGKVFCIAVTGKDLFCTRPNLGYSHPRCFEHAKCLQKNSVNCVGYAPEQCTVCMEYLNYCDTSLSCCEKIFRMFKHSRKKFGFRFDWNDKKLKDWFFSNYRNLQCSNPSVKSSNVSYVEFIKSLKVRSDNADREPPKKVASQAHTEPPTKGVTHAPSEPPAKVTALANVDGKVVSLSDARKNIIVAEKENSMDDFCSFLTRYTSVRKKILDKDRHFYYIKFGSDDPFINEICKNVEYFENTTIPSTSLLSGVHVEFQSLNEGIEQIMMQMYRTLKPEDICFQIGKIKGYCSERLMERFNFTASLTRSQFNLYSALRALREGIVKFTGDTNSNSAESGAFYNDLIQALDYLAKEMVLSLKYYIKLVVTDKRRLRRTGFKYKVKDATMLELVRKNILSSDLFDKTSLVKATASKSIGVLINKENVGSETMILDGTSVLENLNLSVKK
ncbi:hypothetical protein SK128_010439 [Halocaridina rubra]|uniref:C2H2-type domain-containing protein n=1 Tax=Halocaridina rubra TaxID=373956 RepID=A0AAN8X8N6_HALRR